MTAVYGKKLKFETHYNCSIIKILNIIMFPAELSIKNNNQNIKKRQINKLLIFWQCVRHIILYNYIIHNAHCTLHSIEVLRDIWTWPKTYNTSAILSCKTFTNYHTISAPVKSPLTVLHTKSSPTL